MTESVPITINWTMDVWREVSRSSGSVEALYCVLEVLEGRGWYRFLFICLVGAVGTAGSYCVD